MFLIVFLVILIFFTWLFIWGIKSNAWVPIFRTVARIGSVVYLILQLMGLRRPLLHSPRDLLREDGCDECCLFDVSSRVEAIQLHGQDLLLCEPVEIDVSHARLSALRRLRRLLHRLVITVFSRYA